MKIFAQ